LLTVPVFSKEWSAAQKDLLNVFNKYIVSSLKGNVEDQMTFFHPHFIGWDYEQKLLTNFLATKKTGEEFYKAYKLNKFVVDPLEIQVENNIGVLHLNFEEKFSDSTGKETTSHGPWTVIMMKQENRWVFLSFCWLQKFEEGK